MTGRQMQAERETADRHTATYRPVINHGWDGKMQVKCLAKCYVMYNKHPWKQLTTLYTKQCAFLKVLWDVAAGRQVNSHWYFKRRSASTFIPTLNMQELRSSKTVATLYRSMRHGISQDCNIHQHYCTNLISRTAWFGIHNRYSYAILPQIHA
jgi:hypothetical protein